MKLFGNKPKREPTSTSEKMTHVSKERTAETPMIDGTPIDPRRIRRPRKQPWYLTAKGRGLVLLLAAVLLLSGVVWGGIAMLTTPPERPGQGANPDGTSTDPSNPSGTATNPETVKIPTINPDTGEVEEVEWEAPGSYKEGFYNIMIVGTDDDGTRTDTIMIARLDANDHTVALMSIPRDTYISINSSVPKLNSVYGLNGKGEKGITALRSQLKAILGFEVDYYLMVDMEAFEVTVDLVEGVEFDVPQRMYYSDPTQNLYIDFAPGVQWLDGADALNMIRFRGYDSADIGRTQVQQDFLKALANRCLDVGNVSKIPGFVDIFSQYVDTDMSATDMIYFGVELLECNFDQMYTVTPNGYATWHGDASCYSLYPGELCDIVNQYFNPYDQDIPLSSIHVRQGPGATTSTPPVTVEPVAPQPSVTPKPETEVPDITVEAIPEQEENVPDGDVETQEEPDVQDPVTEEPEQEPNVEPETSPEPTPDPTLEPELPPEPTPEPPVNDGGLDLNLGV